GRDLLEVVELLPAPRVAVGNAAHHRDEALDQAVAGRDVALFPVGAQERAAIRLRNGAGTRQPPGTTPAACLFLRRTTAGAPSSTKSTWSPSRASQLRRSSPSSLSGNRRSSGSPSDPVT